MHVLGPRRDAGDAVAHRDRIAPAVDEDRSEHRIVTHPDRDRVRRTDDRAVGDGRCGSAHARCFTHVT